MVISSVTTARQIWSATALRCLLSLLTEIFRRNITVICFLGLEARFVTLLFSIYLPLSTAIVTSNLEELNVKGL